MPLISFTDEDLKAHNPNQDDPMVITFEIANYKVNKALIN